MCLGQNFTHRRDGFESGNSRSSAFNAQQHNIVEKEIQTLFSKAPKSDGSSHMIFNFKQFNEFPERHHFKIDTLETVISMMKRYMASVDLKDVYYPEPIHPAHQKYLKFAFKGTLYHYTCLPIGLASASSIFTK